jgi:ribosome-binding factor A
MATEIRTQRVAVRIREALSEMFLTELTDPALVGVSVSDVAVDRELEYATIYISSLDGEVEQEAILEGCRRASGFLRHNLSQRIELRSFPHLRFKWDPTPQRAARIDELFAQLATEEKPEQEPEVPSEDD